MPATRGSGVRAPADASGSKRSKVAASFRPPSTSCTPASDWMYGRTRLFGNSAGQVAVRPYIQSLAGVQEVLASFREQRGEKFRRIAQLLGGDAQAVAPGRIEFL